MSTKTRLGIEDLIVHREEILKIAEKHGAYNVRVFGSVARGEATDESDIDLLVDYDLNRISPWFPAGLKRELESFLEREVDIGTPDGFKERYRERILSEAIPL